MNILEDEELMGFEGKQQSPRIINPSDMVEDVLKQFNSPSRMGGIELPWPRTKDRFSIRTSEVTLWAGINGHGKSALLNQICALTSPVTRWLIASLEMPVRNTMQNMVKQMGGAGNPTDDYVKQILKKTENRIWLYDRLDTVPSDIIISVIHYACMELGVKHFVIDSLVKCGISTDDYNKQKDFVDQLCVLAKRYDVGIHLVHHIRKGEREGKTPDKFDIKGAGEIADLVDNICIVHRNKDKEKKLREGKPVDEGIPDTTLIIAKQRHYGIEDSFPLYYHADSLQFLSSPKAPPFSI